MTDEQSKHLFTVLRLIQMELEELNAKQVAIEKVFLENPDVRQKYENEVAEARRGPRLSPSLDTSLEELRKSLFSKE